ncbi:MAG: GNAT family N-acetyltransferase [Pseudonocardiaceae bacterium]
MRRASSSPARTPTSGRISRHYPYPAQTRERFGRWMEQALTESAAGRECAFAIIDRHSGTPIGSTRYLALRPEHRRLEIGWTCGQINRSAGDPVDPVDPAIRRFGESSLARSPPMSSTTGYPPGASACHLGSGGAW